jgi:hypothetical protein
MKIGSRKGAKARRFYLRGGVRHAAQRRIAGLFAIGENLLPQRPDPSPDLILCAFAPLREPLLLRLNGGGAGSTIERSARKG